MGHQSRRVFDSIVGRGSVISLNGLRTGAASTLRVRVPLSEKVLLTLCGTPYHRVSAVLERGLKRLYIMVTPTGLQKQKSRYDLNVTKIRPRRDVSWIGYQSLLVG